MKLEARPPCPRALVRWCASWVLVLGCLAGSAAAQSQATTGVIRGDVVDPSGAPASGVLVSVRNVDTNFTRRILTNSTGTFVATLLPLGEYEVVADADERLESTRIGGVHVGLGESIVLQLVLEPLQLDEVTVSAGAAELLDFGRIESAVELDREISALPNNGRNYLEYMFLSPHVALTQGPDGDEIAVAGQRGIHNNVSVDGADFNNPFFGEQRGGQRPAMTFNLDAVEEMVIVSQGASAEFGRSSAGFVNVVTRSGTNAFEGSAHHFYKSDAISAGLARGAPEPDFTQQQFGFTLGGPIRRDRAFFFLAYDQQVFDETKQQAPGRMAPELVAWMDTAFSGALAGDHGPIDRTDDARAFLAKVDWHLGDRSRLALKYNYASSEQVNGTFDVDSWGRSANALEKDVSHAFNGSLTSQLTPTVSNELRFQFARENRPRPYRGPTLPGGRPFPDTGMDFAAGYRFGMPFFIPVEARFDRFQLLNNLSILKGDHLIKVGAEWNRTDSFQQFTGFGNGRFIFSSVPGFLNYVDQGPTYVECSGGGSSTTGSCPAGEDITGPLLLFLQFAPIDPASSVEEAGTQSLVQNELAAFIQDSWQVNPHLRLDYGLRWEAQIQPKPITTPDEVFYSGFIGETRMGRRFPSDGRIPSDWFMLQPRLGMTWNPGGDRTQLLRASAGLFYARVPSLNLASARTTNGSIGQVMFRASFFNGFGVTPPAYDELLAPDGSAPDHPDIFVVDEDFRNPRTLALHLEYEREIVPGWGASLGFSHLRTDHLTRFVNRNDPLFGDGEVGPFHTGLSGGGGEPISPGDTLNGISSFSGDASGLNVAESTARSRYYGVVFGLVGELDGGFRLGANYTLSFDRSDDDNERDPFTYRYARADRLDADWGWSDRDQRHRLNAWALVPLTGGIHLTSRIRAYSAQPMSERCGPDNRGTGERAAAPVDRACPDGSVLTRNTLRRDNAFFSWDLRLSKVIEMGGSQSVELMVDVFNVLNTDNFQDPSPKSLLFNFDGTIRSGLGDPRQVQTGLRWRF